MLVRWKVNSAFSPSEKKKCLPFEVDEVTGYFVLFCFPFLMSLVLRAKVGWQVVTGLESGIASTDLPLIASSKFRWPMYVMSLNYLSSADTL